MARIERGKRCEDVKAASLGQEQRAGASRLRDSADGQALLTARNRSEPRAIDDPDALAREIDPATVFEHAQQP